ncbi:MAG: homoserine dehydrogenase [Candidatus Syntrophoarchaeum sp. WYZ-LMO15]|nr:MAG: homoserine dehydrogenase [Candidatus Syntrophoarchaeum sp. WYZ-LMO15]
MEQVKIIIVGFGTVGRGLAEVIKRKKDHVKEEFGLDIRLVGVADLRGAMVDADGLDIDDALEWKCEIRDIDSLQLIREGEYDLMVETTPSNVETGEPGFTHIKEALMRGKHVVTSNKGPLALYYRELTDLAARSGCSLKFEATVGGAMPIINLIRNNLAGNRILSIKGIFNGTCNYILTRMTEEGLPYSYVLSEAQSLGIAEADPSYDVDGIDTAEKLTILANAVLGMDVAYNSVAVEGIRRITPDALRLALDKGYVIKLIGEAREGKIEVAPRLIPKDHPFALMRGTLNIAEIEADLAGPITVMGRGAGAIEAASAIFSDIISIYR